MASVTSWKCIVGLDVPLDTRYISSMVSFLSLVVVSLVTVVTSSLAVPGAFSVTPSTSFSGVVPISLTVVSSFLLAVVISTITQVAPGLSLSVGCPACSVSVVVSFSFGVTASLG